MDLKTLKELEKTATPKPWKAFENGAWGGQGFGVSIGEDTNEWVTTNEKAQIGENCLLLAAARNHIAELIERVEGLSAKLLDIKTLDPSATRRDEMVDEALAKFGADKELGSSNLELKT